MTSLFGAEIDFFSFAFILILADCTLINLVFLCSFVESRASVKYGIRKNAH